MSCKGLTLRVGFLSSLLPIGFTGNAFEIIAVVIHGIVVFVINFFASTAFHLPPSASTHLVLYFVLFTVCFDLFRSSSILFLVVTCACHKVLSALIQGLLLA